MKILLHIIFILVLTVPESLAQQTIPRQYVPESGRISLSSVMPFFQAIQALNEISSRLEQKIIIDDQQRTDPINVEIADLYWRDALNIIVKIQRLEYEEYRNYIKITGMMPVKTGSTAARSKEEAAYNSSLREVNISAIFFEGDKHALQEKGINWDVLIREADVYYNAAQPVAGSINLDITRESEATQSTQQYGQMQPKDESIKAFVQALESDALGEILASPNIQVLEGEEGRVQVGQDFSVKQVDFAGNVTDNFISTGIILSVKPQVIKEDSLDFIHLLVHVERSSASPGQISTIINKTEANTSLLLLDTEKAVIAGLFSSVENNDRGGIPLLRDLPGWFFGLRYLFGHERKEKVEKELIIIIQAHLLPTLSLREAGTVNNDDYIELKRKELKNRIKQEAHVFE